MPQNDNRKRRARKSPRLPGYDYSREGAYFITANTQDRVHLFGEVVDEEMRLNDMGQIAESCWRRITDHFPHVELDAFVVMPNHVHGVILILEQPSDTSLTDRVGTQHAASLQTETSKGATWNNVKPGSLSAIVRSYKSAVTKQINHLRDTPGAPVWQSRYHDHIIRNKQSLNDIRRYIKHNPALWEEDTFYSS